MKKNTSSLLFVDRGMRKPGKPPVAEQREYVVRSRPATEFIASNDTAALIKACLAGEPVAWEQLVRRYQRLVYAIPRRAGLSEDSAAEVFQRVWMILFEHLAQIEQPEYLGSWLATTARRESWRQLRQERMAQAVPLELSEEQELLTDTSLMADEQLEQLQRQQAVREALAQLDPRCQTLLKLLFYTDQPAAYAEIAATLGIAEGSIGPTRIRCLRKLQRIIEAYEY